MVLSRCSVAKVEWIFTMRAFILISLAAATVVATPAAAQRRPAPTLDQAATLLADPMAQDVLAALVGQVADAVLQTRVGPLAELADPGARLHPDDTLGGVVRRDDPGFDSRLRDDTRRTAATAGRALGGAAAMNRELRATAERLRAVLGGIGGY
jgi:hypothetical protein